MRGVRLEPIAASTSPWSDSDYAGRDAARQLRVGVWRGGGTAVNVAATARSRQLRGAKHCLGVHRRHSRRERRDPSHDPSAAGQHGSILRWSIGDESLGRR